MPAMLEPVPDFLVDPVRSGGLRGQHQNNEARALQRLGDLAPQVGVCRQVRVITKHAQRPQLTHPPPNMVQALLDSGGYLAIPVRVRQERVVLRRLALFGSRGVHGPCYLGQVPSPAEHGYWPARVPAANSKFVTEVSEAGSLW